MSKRPNEVPYSQEAAPMDQVRDILFGAQLKDLETRFQRQEERFTREINDARDAMKTRMDSLENFMKSENMSLAKRIKEESAERDSLLKSEQRERGEAIKSEQRERVEAIKGEQRERGEAVKSEQRERGEAVVQLGKELAAAVESFERKLTKLSGLLDNSERELRQLLMTESGSLGNKIEDRYQDALDVISTTAAQIRHDMVYRSSLSGMFNDVAVKLSNQRNGEIVMPVAEAGAELQRKGKNAQNGELEQKVADA